VAVVQRELLEREMELGELRVRLDHVRGGCGGLVLVEGEAGIGKTVLIRALCAEASGLGMQVLGARATEFERDFPFAVVRQLFEPGLAAVAPEVRSELLSGAARPAGRLLGFDDDEGAGDAGSTTPVDPSFAALNGLFWLVSNLAERGPLLLAVDDAHWADAPSLRCLEFLLPRLEDLAVLVVLAARPADPGASKELLARVSLDADASVVRPRALSPSATALLIRSQLGAVVQDGLCAAAHEVTAGNPFMLREVVAECASRGIAGRDGEAGMVRDMAPLAIGRVVSLRLGRLSEAARGLARAVAVVGDDRDLRLAATVAGLDLAVAREAADELVAAGVLDPGRRLGFVHPLVRNAVSAGLAPSERNLAHARVASLLAESGADPERVALHLLATTPAGRADVVELLCRGARRALDRAAPEVAVRLLRRALVEPAPEQARPAILRDLITAGVRASDGTLVQDIGHDLVAELSGDSRTLLASAWQLTRWLLVCGRAQEVVPLVDRAVRVASEDGQLELALHLEALVASSSLVSPARARTRMARHGDAVVSGTAAERLWLALQSWYGTFLGDSAAHCGEMARSALADGRIFVEQADSPPPAQAILVLIRTEQLDLADDRIDAFANDGSVRGSAFALAQACFLRAHLALARGEVARATAEAHSAVQAARRAGYLQAVYGAVLLDALIEGGDLDAAEREMALAGWDGALAESYWSAPLRLSRARLRMAQHKTREALGDLLELERAYERAGMSNPFYLPACDVALALAVAGRPQDALRRVAAAGELARVWGTPSAIATALRVKALLTPGEQGLELMREAVSTAHGSPARLEYTRALTDYGAALRRAGQRAHAREPLREALALARRAGAMAIARRAHRELGATGEKLRPLGTTSIESLTPSERRVSELAASGLRNREIAQTLFLTVKTVETHLIHAYRKLDISSRTELPAQLQHPTAGSTTTAS